MAVLAPPVQVVASGAPPFVQVPSGAPPFVVTTGPAPPIMIVASGAPPITLFNDDGSLWAAGGAAVGGAALLTGEANGFATDFLYATDASRVALKTSGSTLAYAVDAFYANAGTSPKMVYDVAGTLGWSPHNYCFRSQEFNDAAWTQSGATATANAIAAPDGTLTADKMIETAAAGSNHNLYHTNNINAITGETFTLSVYAKAGERTWLALALDNGDGSTDYFDLANGVVGTSPKGGIMTDAGNGWWRCSIRGTNWARNPAFFVRQSNGQGVYTGDGTSGLYLWGAQLNRGSVALPYLPTTTAARFGLAVDYHPSTHAALGLLCEQQATNLLLNNAALSTQSVTVTAAAHTLSFLGTGTITLTGTSTAGPLVGTGASNRVSLTFTPTAGSLTLTVSGTVSNAQLETGSVATSIIRTFGASVTRIEDSYRITPASINYSATAGSWWVDATPISLIGYSIVGFTNGTAAPAYIQSSTILSMYDATFTQKTVGNSFAAHKIAAAYAAGDRAFTVDGAAVASDAGSTTNLLNPGNIGFGCVPGFASSTGNMYIRKIRYLPRRKTNLELVTETT